MTVLSGLDVCGTYYSQGASQIVSSVSMKTKLFCPIVARTHQLAMLACKWGSKLGICDDERKQTGHSEYGKLVCGGMSVLLPLQAW